MGLIDRVFGRRNELETQPAPEDVPVRDAAAVEAYERMLRTGPDDVIERAHVEAFARLTPAQLDVLFERFTSSAVTVDERPADARPESLARSATRAERRRPGSIRANLDDTRSRAETNAVVSASIFDAVIWYSLASVAWSDWDAPAAADEPAADGAAEAPPLGAPDPGADWDFGL